MSTIRLSMLLGFKGLAETWQLTTSQESNCFSRQSSVRSSLPMVRVLLFCLAHIENAEDKVLKVWSPRCRFLVFKYYHVTQVQRSLLFLPAWHKEKGYPPEDLTTQINNKDKISMFLCCNLLWAPNKHNLTMFLYINNQSLDVSTYESNYSHEKCNLFKTILAA